MKKLLLLILALNVFTGICAQNTYLEIDNQVPGQLSTRLTYSDQKNIHDIKVTGYMNIDDYKFIGSLIQKYNLKGKIDLADVYSVNESPFEDNEWRTNVFGLVNKYSDKDTVQCLIYPRLIFKSNSPLSEYIHVDTVMFDCEVNSLHKKYFRQSQFESSVGCIICGEKVDSIEYCAFQETSDLKSIILTQNLRYIGGSAFNASGLCDINWNDFKNSLEYLGTKSLYCKWTPDSLVIPEAFTELSNAFQFKDNEHVFLGKNIKSIDAYFNAAITIHIKATNPPSMKYYCNDRTTVYVPKGFGEKYKSSAKWSLATIIEENPVEEVRFDKHEIVLKVGESEELCIDILPANADNKSLIWKSDDESVVIVNVKGVISAVGPGKTKVWAISNDNAEAKDYCEVIVNQPVTGITLSESALTMTKIGESVKLTASVQPENASNKEVRWNSSNSAVCMVSGDGTIIALSEGTSVVTATTVEGGFIAVCVVTVTMNDGIPNVSLDGLSGSREFVDVYNMQGGIVKRNIPAYGIKQLQKGIYLVNGKKIIIK